MKTPEVLEKHPPTRDNLLNILHDIQENNPYNNITEEDVKLVASYLNTTYASVYGVISYYSMLSFRPRGKYIIRLCKSPVCRMVGSYDILNSLINTLGINMGDTTHDRLFTLEPSECLGQCDKAPVLMINDRLYTEIDDYKVNNLIQSIRDNENQNS
jgi:NADH:ubiquinone oxidoreductase subunit E